MFDLLIKLSLTAGLSYLPLKGVVRKMTHPLDRFAKLKLPFNEGANRRLREIVERSGVENYQVRSISHLEVDELLLQSATALRVSIFIICRTGHGGCYIPKHDYFKILTGSIQTHKRPSSLETSELQQ